MLKTFVREYLHFTRKERIGIAVLLSIAISCMLLPFCYPLFNSKRKTISPIRHKLTGLQRQAPDSAHYGVQPPTNYHRYNQEYKKEGYYRATGELFYFDPNTATVEDWRRLGLRERTITTIQNYLSKGGHFRHPQDISKIWGLHEDEVQRLLPYIRIAAAPVHEKRYAPVTYPKQDNSYSKPPRTININEADTTAFIDLPGIGSKLAGRIVAFRNKLGGFHSVEQLAETYGLPDSTFQRLKNRLTIGLHPVKQLNINEVSLDVLKQHPYIRYHLANAIIQYRTQHGSFAKVEDVRKIMMVTAEVYTKIAPYLTVDK